MKDCLMSLKIRKNKFSIFITLLLILALLTGLTAGYFSTHGITENGKFEAFSGKVFQNEVSGSTLTSIIPWHIRKNRVSGEKKLLLALSPQI